MRNQFSRFFFCLFSLLMSGLLWVIAPGLAQEMPVPAAMQAVIFKKVLAYDKKLEAETNLKILVAYADASASTKDAVVKAFADVGISASAVKVDQLAGSISSASAVYLSAGTQGAKALCQKNKVLSLTGIPAWVENGSASVGLGVADGKPKIYVHMGELKAEGHEFSSKLLQLAKVIE